MIVLAAAMRRLADSAREQNQALCGAFKLLSITNQALDIVFKFGISKLSEI
jgi:hypothetical protein